MLSEQTQPAAVLLQASATRLISVLAALMIAVGGYVHFCLYRHGYRFIPDIGVGFLGQAFASLAVSVSLVAPLRLQVRLGRLRLDGSSLALVMGLGIGLGTLAAFWVSRTSGGLFGFQEHGFNPAPRALIAVVAESGACVLLAALLFGRRRRLPR
jgi:hypothetical protein